MRSILNKLVGFVLAALIVLAPTRLALAGEREEFVVFGDSLSDPGNAFVALRRLGTPPFVTVPPFLSLIPDAPYARGALHFSNGPTWIEQLSVIDHAVPSAGPELVLPRVFSNYAVGGARARGSGPYDLSGQINLFLGDFRGRGPAGALYVLWAGGDDLRDALEALAADSSGGTSLAILQQAVSSIYSNLLTLYGAGARRFLVPNAPDIGLAPAILLQGPGVQGAARFLSSQFNSGLEQTLAGLDSMPGVEIVRLDVFTIVQKVVAAPAHYGLTDVQDPCIRLDTFVRAFCARPDQFLFWDGIHPTVAGHRILAGYANTALGGKPATR
jgi:phospholipase/lecithinase/hemolysin